MYRKLLSLSVFAGAMMILAAAGNTTRSAAASPAIAGALKGEAFWRCPSGYSFETSGSAVHCKKPSWTETRAFMPCGIPTPDLKLDLVSQTDMCAGNIGTTVSVEPQCYPSDLLAGFVKRHVAGKDFCGKSHPAEVIAPNLMVTL
jgi:hypothetical protein